MERPRTNNGKFVSTRCPMRDCDGTLKPEGNGVFMCNGLLDPGDPSKELEPCFYTHINHHVL